MEDFSSICKNNEFRRIYSKGRSFVTPLLVLYVLKNGRTKSVRVGITTSKKIGNAVLRNRSRRVLREAFRELSPRICVGNDLILVARGKTPYAKSYEVKKHMEKQLLAAGLLKPAAFCSVEKEIM